MWNVVSKPFLNAAYIFPTKQRAVHAMIEVCKKDINVRKLIIFGSSVTSAFHPWSDIDAYFELISPVPNLPFTAEDNQAWDRWSNFSVDSNLLAEIQEKGVVVYDQEEK